MPKSPQQDPKGIKEEFRPWLKGAGAIFISALVLRIIHILAMRHSLFFSHPIQDEFTYYQFARTAVETGNWSGSGAFYQAPLYQYFLAVIFKFFGPGFLVPRIVQAFVDAMSAAGIYLIGSRYFSKKTGWIAGVGAAVYSQFIYNTGTLLPTTITLFLEVALFLSLLYLTERWKRAPGRVSFRNLWPWIIPGILFGLQALAATNILALMPLFWAWILWCIFPWQGKSRAVDSAHPKSRTADTHQKKAARTTPAQNSPTAPGLALRIAAIFFFSAGAGMTIAPVTLHNYVVGKELILISYNAGINFYIGNSGDYEKKILSRVGYEWDKIKAVGERATSYKDASQKFMEASYAWMGSHPLEYAGLLLHKSYLLLQGGEIYRNQAIYPDRLVSPVLGALLWKAGIPGGPGIAVPWGLLLPACIAGLYLAFRKRDRKSLWFAAFWVLYSGTIIAFFVTERYRIALVPPMLFLAGSGWSRVSEWWPNARVRWTILGATAACAVFINWNQGPMQKEMNHDAYLSVAEQFYNTGDTLNAIAGYRKGIQLAPEDANGWYLMAWHGFESREQFDSAAAYYRRANDLLPANKDILLGLARVAARQDRVANACRYLEQAKAASPFEVGNVFEGMGNLSIQGRNFRAADQYFAAALQVDPQSHQSLLGSAIAAFELRGMASALPCFDRLFSVYPNSADGYINLALILARSGNASGAVDAAMKAMTIDRSISAGQLLREQAARCGRQQDVEKFLTR